MGLNNAWKWVQGKLLGYWKYSITWFERWLECVHYKNSRNCTFIYTLFWMYIFNKKWTTTTKNRNITHKWWNIFKDTLTSKKIGDSETLRHNPLNSDTDDPYMARVHAPFPYYGWEEVISTELELGTCSLQFLNGICFKYPWKTRQKLPIRPYLTKISHFSIAPCLFSLIYSLNALNLNTCFSVDLCGGTSSVF